MDFDMIAFFFFATIALIVIGVSVNGIVQKIVDYKTSKLGLESQERGRSVGLADRTDLIEDRLRVLERLATDRGALLSDEIESLRGEIHDRRKLEEPRGS